MHSHDAGAGSLVLIQSKMLPLHFSREFLCDCSAATLAAITCARSSSPRLATPPRDIDLRCSGAV
jgi:hypothetical protein